MNAALSASTGDGAADAGGARHGQWRILLPALLSWAVVAALIHRPGSGRALALAAAAAGAVCSVLLVTARARAARQSPAEAQVVPDAVARAGHQRERARLPAGRKAATCAFLLVCCAALLTLGGRVEWLERSRNAPEIADLAGSRTPVSAAVKLGGYPQATAGFGDEEGSWVRGSLTSVAGKRFPTPVPAILWLPTAPDERWHPGARITLQGTLDPTPPESLAAYEMRVSAQEYAGPAGGVGRWTGPAAANMRSSLRAAAAQHASARLVPGLAVGDTSLVDEELDRLMLESNLTHLTAVSGSNCALVITAITAVAQRLGLGRRMRVILGAATLGAFVTLVGPDASVQRAALMAGVLLVSRFGGKQRQALPALGLATFVLLIADPWQAIQPGFALSVTATAGILLWATPLQTWLTARLRLPVVLALPLAIAAVAQFVCAPLLLLLQPGLPVGGVLANLLAAPAAPVGTGLGMLALLGLQFNVALGEILLQLGSYPARWIEASGTVGVAVPGARWYWPGGRGGAVLLTIAYLLLAVARAAASGWFGGRPRSLKPWRANPRRSPSDRPLASALSPVRRSSWAGGTQRTVVRASAGLAAGMLIGVAVVVPIAVKSGVPDDWVVVACDVGQGDALLVRSIEQPDRVLLIDTGDNPDLLAACLDTFGVSRIDLLVLTHNHRDHVAALGAVRERVDKALVAPASVDDEGGRALDVTLDREGITSTTGVAGMAGGVGSTLEWAVLGPQPAQAYGSANATSLVMLVETSGLRLLLLGDTGEPEQRALMRAWPDLLRAEVVKVAHHGSRDQAPGLYSAIDAQIGLISVGEGNRYGHPTGALLEQLAETGTLAARTDQLGSIAIRSTSDGLVLWGAGARGALLVDR